MTPAHTAFAFVGTFFATARLCADSTAFRCIDLAHPIWRDVAQHAAYVAASFTESVSDVILAMAGLETLGLGPPRIPTLDMTIQNALQATAIIRGMWWWCAPLVMLVIIFVALFLMTIGLDEIANPRLRGRRHHDVNQSSGTD